MTPLNIEFDPFRVVVSFASEADTADLFIKTFTGIGLSFDVVLVGDDNFSHGNRIRALQPRVLTAYEQLSVEAKLAAANAAAARFLSLIERLAPTPFRDSGIDFTNGVSDGAFAISVFPQPWPSAHGLAQGARTGALPPFWEGHRGNAAQAAPHE